MTGKSHAYASIFVGRWDEECCARSRFWDRQVTYRWRRRRELATELLIGVSGVKTESVNRYTPPTTNLVCHLLGLGLHVHLLILLAPATI